MYMPCLNTITSSALKDISGVVLSPSIYCLQNTAEYGPGFYTGKDPGGLFLSLYLRVKIAAVCNHFYK